MLNDFSLRSNNIAQEVKKNNNTISDLQLSIFPNPSFENLNLDIKRNNHPENIQSYTVIFKNLITNKTTIKQNYFPNSLIDVSNLELGQYFVEVINTKGEKAGSNFIKL